jgi:hypothetical protein
MCTPNAFVTNETANDEERTLEERADRHVRRLEGFYAHLASYVGVNALLVGINLFASPGVFWAIWPILGWGVKVAGHAVAVFGVPGRSDWREQTRAAFLRRHGGAPGRTSGPRGSERKPDDETERLRRRVEHLEAIVTSADWDLVLDRTPANDSPERRSARLAEEVVSG